MKQSKAQLLELTRCGLWGTNPDTTLFEKDVDWLKLISMAKEQTLLGVIYNAIERLPSTLQPERAVMLSFFRKVTFNRKYRIIHIEVLAKMYELLKRVGVERPVLLKGLGVAENYPDPSLRHCGDIDIYVGPEHYEAVCEFFCAELGVTRESENDLHLHFRHKGVEVEIHKYALTARNIAYRRDELVKWCTNHLEGDSLREAEIEGVKVYLPPYEFDFIYIFYHTWRHFLSGGIGLRQVCDWCCYVNAFYDKIDKDKVLKTLSYFRLERPISMFASIAVEELGLGKDKYPNYTPYRVAIYKEALDKILEGGDFGHYRNERKGKSKTIFTRKIKTFRAMLNDMCFMFKLDPFYTYRFYRVLYANKIGHAFRNRSKLKKKL